MSFSKVTLQIMARLQRWRVDGDPDADRELAEHIDAVVANRPLPPDSDAKRISRAGEASVVLDRRKVIEECRRRACRKILEGQSLDEAEENAMVFGDVENL